VAVPFRIKICGITNPADVSQAARLGADAIGLNFYPRSPRYVEPDSARRITKGLPSTVEAIGVFVNQRLAEMTDVASRVTGLRTFQSHGENDELADPSPLRLILACPVANRNSLDAIMNRLKRYQEQGWQPAAILVDAEVAGSYGGTGRQAPWELLADFRPTVPIILAGGLDPDNVAEAIRIVQPYGVDVASGVERAPGIKDADKMKRFIDNARTARDKLGC
jgi:phosphoribosylanthranilate isomerase